MLRSAQICCIKHNIRSFHINDISNNNDTITLKSTKNNKQEFIITLTKLHVEDIWIHTINISIFLKRNVFNDYLKVANVSADLMFSGSLFHREGAQEPQDYNTYIHI